MRCAACVVLLVLVLAAGAFAGADEDAKTHYVAGEKALADFDLETAIKELSAAVQLKPSSLAARDKLTEAYAAYVKFLKGEVETWKKRQDELAAKKDSQVIKIVARGESSDSYDSAPYSAPAPAASASTQRSPAAGPADQASGPAKQERPAFTVVRTYWSQRGAKGGTWFAGTCDIRNDSKATCSLVGVRIGYTENRTGKQIHSETVYIEGLAPGRVATAKADKELFQQFIGKTRQPGIPDLYTAEVIEVEAYKSRGSGPIPVTVH